MISQRRVEKVRRAEASEQMVMRAATFPWRRAAAIVVGMQQENLRQMMVEAVEVLEEDSSALARTLIALMQSITSSGADLEATCQSCRQKRAGRDARLAQIA